MPTLWDLVSEPLAFSSVSSDLGSDTGVTSPSTNVLESTDEWCAERCVHDPNILDALERSVEAALRPQNCTDDFTRNLRGLHRNYVDCHPNGTDLSSERAVLRFLDSDWKLRTARILSRFVQVKRLGRAFYFAGSDTTQRQQFNLHARLVPIDPEASDVDDVDVSIVEVKSEGIVRRYWKDIMDRGKRGVKVDWEGRGRWDVVDKIVVNVAAYLAHYKLTWLCWTAASHLLVFRLVRKPQQKPYLVISDVVQVDDSRQPFRNPPDQRIGERWMTCVVGCALAGIAAQSNGDLAFDVEDLTSVNGEPNLTPSEEERNATASNGLLDSSHGRRSPSKGGSGRIAAILMRSTPGVSYAFGAPLIASSLLIEEDGPKHDTSYSDETALPCEFWKEQRVASSSIPKLEFDRVLGEGSTGIVHAGMWNGKPVAVKIAEGVKERQRLLLEGSWYIWLSQRGAGQGVLPTFLGCFRHSSFDVLVMSQEGSTLASWDDLQQGDRFLLFSLVRTLHQAGIRHGDIEPRNVLRSPTGQLRLVDLSEASRHECPSKEDNRPDSRKRYRRLCLELAILSRELGLDLGLRRRKRNSSISTISGGRSDYVEQSKNSDE